MSEELKRRVRAEMAPRAFRRRRRRARYSPLLVAASVVLLLGILAMAVSVTRGRPDLRRPPVLSQGDGTGGTPTPGVTVALTPMATVSPTGEKEEERNAEPMPTMAVNATFTPRPEMPTATRNPLFTPVPEADGAEDSAVFVTPEPTPTMTLNATFTPSPEEATAEEAAATVFDAKSGRRLTIAARQIGANLLLVERRFDNECAVYDSVVSANGWDTLGEAGLDYAERAIASVVDPKTLEAWESACKRSPGSGIVFSVVDVVPLLGPDSSEGASMNMGYPEGYAEEYLFYDPDDPGHRIGIYRLDEPSERTALPLAVQLMRGSFYFDGVNGRLDSTLVPKTIARADDGGYIVSEDFSTLDPDTSFVEVPVARTYGALTVSESTLWWEECGLEFGINAIEMPDGATVLLISGPMPNLTYEYIPAADTNEGRMTLEYAYNLDFGAGGWYLPDGMAADDALVLRVSMDEGEMILKRNIGELEFVSEGFAWTVDEGAVSPENRMEEGTSDAGL